MVPLCRVASDCSDFVLTGQRLSLGAQRVFVSLFHDCVSNETSLPSGLFSTSLIQLSPSGVCAELYRTFILQVIFIYFCNVIVVLTDFVRGALQPSFQHVEDSRLKTLSQDLPEVLLKSKSANTAKKYERGFNSWRKWASQFKEIKIFPASSIYVSLFFLSLIYESVSCSIIDEVHYGLKWFHDLAGQPDPCNSPFVSQLIESAKRLLSVPVKKKEPVTPEVIQRLVAHYGSASASLSDLRLLILCVLGYAGFFRFNELVQLRRCDFLFEDSFMRIFVQRSKTDIYRDGAWVVIAKTLKPTCPVTLTLRYFAVASFLEDSEDYIFRPLTFRSSYGSYSFRGSAPLSYSRAREIVLSAFEAVGLSKLDYGLHSLRAGGASAAANAQISDRLFKRHGRWKSDKAKDGYIKDNILALLSVSLSLGI